tara:strand:- start:2357 stop:2491 length:135 start_codon:yes stop_codon:yes gene_type:complete
MKEVTFSIFSLFKKIPSNKRSGTSPLQKTIKIITFKVDYAISSI